MSSRIEAKKVARAVMVAAIVLGGSSCGGGSTIPWQIISCLINLLYYKEPLSACSVPVPPPCPSGCTRGRALSNGDGTCTWKSDPNGVKCGKNFQFERQDPFDPTVIDVITTCTECSAGTTLIGYDAIPPVTTPPNVASITPPPGRLLDPKGNIAIKFKQTMDATSVVLSSDLAGEAAPYAFSRSADQFLFNDTLTVAPLATWQSGRRTLTVDVKDDSGNPAKVTASWFVPAPGQAAAPDFSTCTTRCGQRWFLPYVVQFEASGGFPPYVWSNPSGVGPPYDRALFAATGTFAGGPTLCFLCPYEFTVCVTDQAQSQTCHQVRWDSGF